MRCGGIRRSVVVLRFGSVRYIASRPDFSCRKTRKSACRTEGGSGCFAPPSPAGGVMFQLFSPRDVHMQKSYMRKGEFATLLEPLERRQLMAAATGTATPVPPMTSSDAAAFMSATASVVAAPRVYLTGNAMTDGVRYNGLVAMLGRNGTPVT